LGDIKLKEKVKLISAITYNPEVNLEEIFSIMKHYFGDVDSSSECFVFDRYTGYYENEMGCNLKKVYISFEKLIEPDDLPDIKIETNRIEDKFKISGKRRVNIDPGYISASKLVLATTKNYSHRLYLRNGIYGDIHLNFSDGGFKANPWTYPDYRDKKNIGYFNEVRKNYLQQKREEKGTTYRSAGVNIDEADKAIDRIKEYAKSTFNRNVLTELGKFGGFFEFEMEKYENPVLVSSMDGVGTKLKVAIMSGIHNTVGQDLVNHCVNDILSCGAKPLFFLDYIGTTNLKAEIIEELVFGLSKACRENNCVLIGGEMAEMPGFYKPTDYDLVGTIVGVVDKSNILDGSKIKKGDTIIGLPSNGLHTNGYSLVRKIFFDMLKYSVSENVEFLNNNLDKELLKVHRSYLNVVFPLIEEKLLNGIAHITGGGLEGNILRLLSEDKKLDINWNSWEWLRIFKLIKKEGNVSEKEMRRVFNLGIGMVLVVSENNLEKVLLKLEKLNEDYKLIGKII